MNKIILIFRYLFTAAYWLLRGGKFRSASEIKRIYTICEQCPFFHKGGSEFLEGYDKCKVCGCNLHPSNKNFNKIAFKITQCPDNPSRWN